MFFIAGCGKSISEDQESFSPQVSSSKPPLLDQAVGQFPKAKPLIVETVHKTAFKGKLWVFWAGCVGAILTCLAMIGAHSCKNRGADIADPMLANH